MDTDRKDLDRISQEIELVKEKNKDRIVIQKEIDKLTEQYLDYQKILVDLDFIIKVQEVEIQKTKGKLKKTNLLKLKNQFWKNRIL